MMSYTMTSNDYDTGHFKRQNIVNHASKQVMNMVDSCLLKG